MVARFRHYEARSGRPLLHAHLLLSVKGQRSDGKRGPIHTTILYENTVAASALSNELVASEVCEELGLTTAAHHHPGVPAGDGDCGGAA
ncbi:relaxase domain-containing protein [Streptomyces sp. NPDC012793]|uniref:relaxase domain-containing protein n=1 Tax=Streptomyces sp. NPDC012793 TaxID=3364849 RepID=UPI0036AEA060